MPRTDLLRSGTLPTLRSTPYRTSLTRVRAERPVCLRADGRPRRGARDRLGAAVDSTPPTAARDSLPRELTEFLIEFSIALQKFAIYPAGHPMLAKTVERLERRLLPLLDTRDSLSLEIGRAHV